MGYVLENGFDLPPLMLTADEIEAAVLGAQWVSRRGDPALARAALDLIAKIAASVPEKLRPYALEPAAGSAAGLEEGADTIDMAQVRLQIHGGRKIALRYRDEAGRESRAQQCGRSRLVYLDTVRLLMAWCELRKDFRHFRTDRVAAAEFLDERYPERPAKLRAQWRRTLKHSRPPEK